MSTQAPPKTQLACGGVYTAGNPIQRPADTAEVCDNFRVMPGNYLRLRSGRTLRRDLGAGSVQQFFPVRLPGVSGSDSQIAQANFGGTIGWHGFTLADYLVDPVTRIETISGANDGNFAASHPAAVCNINDRAVFYNGLGVRDTTNSRPPFSTYFNLGTRYFGLDAYMPARSLDFVSATLSVSAGGTNKWTQGIRFYVGLWHVPTDHFSNGIFVTKSVSPFEGSVQIINLNNLSVAYHTTNERDELRYVFYATIDGGQIPYLILNSTLDGPLAVPVTTTTCSLAIDPSAVNGWNLDLSSEMPTENFPPRPMRSIAFVNGRLYGALLAGGANDHTDYGVTFSPFSYVPTSRERAGVCWSAAAGDATQSNYLGDPLQSWPLRNVSYTPSAEEPLIVASANAGHSVLVVTATSAFYLEEQADGLHEWVTISRVHGIANPATLRETDHGTVWVTQRNQIVLLRPGATKIDILSDTYATLLTGTPRCADYILDPTEFTDRYQVWLDTGVAVCHDFLLNGPGVAYTASNHDFTAAASPTDSTGKTHHLLAKNKIYTHELQPEGGVVVTDDGAEITGTYRRNWDDFGNADVRKEMPMVDVIGDGDPAHLTLKWYGDFEQVTPGNEKAAVGAHVTQSATNQTYRYKLASANKFWYKLTFILAGHSADNGGSSSAYPSPASEGNNANNFYGSLLRLMWRLGVSENRA